MLQDEISKAFKRPNFVNLISQSFENTSRPFPEEYVEFLCQLLRLSPIQTVSLAFALTQSKKNNLATVGYQIVKNFLPLVSGNFVNDIMEDTLKSLLAYVLRDQVRNEFSILFIISFI